jgi:glycosyltransferase involved in cell wall biosynthesis
VVSVIVPVYNAAYFLELAVNSILPHPQVGEILLIEDGSTDGSLEVCNHLKEKDSRIKVFVHENGSNKGAAESRNLGIKYAKFPFVAFLDSDDKYFENRFEESVEILRANPFIMGCYGKVVVNYLDANYQKLMGVPVGMNSKKLFSYILNGGYFHTNSITVRKLFLEKIGGFNQYCWPHEDVELWTRLAYYGELQSISSELPVAEYTIHGENLSQVGNWKSKWTLWITVLRNFFFKSISLTDRYFILKQLGKSLFSRFKSNDK